MPITSANDRAATDRLTLACLLVCALLLCALAVGHIAGRKNIVRLGYELGETSDELQKLENNNRRLRLERSTLSSPERVQRFARSLGLAPARAEQVLPLAKPDHLAAKSGGGPRER